MIFMKVKKSKPKMLVILTPKSGVQMPPDIEMAFNEHYNKMHLPLMLKVPGITEIRRFKIEPEKFLGPAGAGEIAEGKKYIVEYDIKDVDLIEKTLTSPERKEAIKDKVIFDYIGKYFNLERFVCIPQYAIVKT